MKKLKQIELEIWEPNPEKPAYLRFAGCRKAKDVFDELYTELKRLDLVPDEYFSIFFKIDEDTLVPQNARVVAYANWGGSEGIYINVDLVGEDETLHLATGKTLSDSSEAFNRMQYIAGVIYKMFTCSGYSANEATLKSGKTTAEEKLNAAFAQWTESLLYTPSEPLSHIEEINNWLTLAKKVKAGESVSDEEIRKVMIQ